MLLMGLAMLFFSVAVVGLAALSIRVISDSKGLRSEFARPLEIAECRYEEGQITPQELDDTKTGLQPGNSLEVSDTLQRSHHS